SNLAEWQRARSAVLAAEGRALGIRPPFPATVTVQVDGTQHFTTGPATNRWGYTMTSFHFHNGADAVVPGVFFVPDAAKDHPVPLILYCHYHGGEFEMGVKSLFVHQRNWPRSTDNVSEEVRAIPSEWLGSWPDGISDLAELYMSPGYAVLSIDEYGFNS